MKENNKRMKKRNTKTHGNVCVRRNGCRDITLKFMRLTPVSCKKKEAKKLVEWLPGFWTCWPMLPLRLLFFFLSFQFFFSFFKAIELSIVTFLPFLAFLEVRINLFGPTTIPKLN